MTEETTTLDDFTTNEQSTETNNNEEINSETGDTSSASTPCPCWADEQDEEWDDLMDEEGLYDPECGHAIDYLRDNINTKIRGSTARHYSTKLRIFIEYLHEHAITIQEVTYTDIDDFMKVQARQGKSESTLSVYLTVIKGVLKHIDYYRDVDPGVRWDFVQEELNASDYQTPEKIEREPLSEKEAKLLFEELKTFRNKLLVQIGIELGPRSRDLRTIKMSDLNIDNQEIELRNTKGGGSYTLPLSEDLSLRLQHWLSVERPSLSYGEDNPYLFPSKEGGALSSWVLNEIIKTAAERAGIQEVIGTAVVTERQKDVFNISKSEKPFYRVTAHTLRHTFSNFLGDSDFDLGELSIALDHDSVETTKKHYHHNESEVKDGMTNAFSNINS